CLTPLGLFLKGDIEAALLHVWVGSRHTRQRDEQVTDLNQSSNRPDDGFLDRDLLEAGRTQARADCRWARLVGAPRSAPAAMKGNGKGLFHDPVSAANVMHGRPVLPVGYAFGRPLR
ncbi:MAG: hypothetical protein LC799_17865, partial [Actinobacteria bacterium]|nr:hypothetical protein [Actinomycetota bacterium]